MTAVVPNTDPEVHTGISNTPAPASNEPPVVEPVVETDPVKIAEGEAAAAKAAEEAAPAEEGKADEPAVEEEYVPEQDYMEYGDPDADAVTAILKEEGISPADSMEFFAEAAKTGDLSKIDVAKLTEKLGAAKARLVVSGITTYFTRQQNAVNETLKAIDGVYGGEDNRKLVMDWSRALSTKDAAHAKVVEGLNVMFDQGGIQATLAAQHLKGLYEGAAGNKSLEIKMVTGDAAASAKAATQTLSRNEYLAAVKVAHDKGDFAEVNRLNAQRAATKR